MYFHAVIGNYAVLPLRIGQDSNLKPTVLETVTLPIELPTHLRVFPRRHRVPGFESCGCDLNAAGVQAWTLLPYFCPRFPAPTSRQGAVSSGK